MQNSRNVMQVKYTIYSCCHLFLPSFWWLDLGHFIPSRKGASENDMHETDHFDEIKRNQDGNTDT